MRRGGRRRHRGALLPHPSLSLPARRGAPLLRFNLAGAGSRGAPPCTAPGRRASRSRLGPAPARARPASHCGALLPPPIWRGGANQGAGADLGPCSSLPTGRGGLR
jgi:hypothetical protein